jgi:hypothetical protein
MHDWFRIQRGDDEDYLQACKKTTAHKLENETQFSLSSPFFFFNCCVYIYALFLAVWAHRIDSLMTTILLATHSLSRSILILLEILYIQHVTEYSALKACTMDDDDEEEEEVCLRYKRDVYKYICPFLYRDRGRIMFTFSI